MQGLKRLIRRIQKFYFRLLGYYPRTINGQRLKLNYEHFAFWDGMAKMKWEAETFQVLSKYLNKDSVYLDIGAWIGPTVVYAAGISKKVICFEPDPHAYRRLLTNLQANKLNHVSPYNVALSNKASISTMVSHGEALGDSTTSLLPKENARSGGFEALVLDWGTVENTYDLAGVDFVKIDIEGGEFFLVSEMESFLKSNKPVLWLSFHAPNLPETDRKEAVGKMVATLQRCYDHCLDAKLNPVDLNTLADHKDSLQFSEFLFYS